MINLKEISSPEFLEQVVQDKELLKSQIESSKGYILYLLEKAKKIPPLDYLMEDFNIYSLNFIVKHYDLSKEQVKFVRQFMTTDNEVSIATAALEYDDIVEHLEAGIVPTINTIIPLDLLNKYASQICNYEEDYDLRKIIANSAQYLSQKEVLNLDSQLLKNFTVNIFTANPKYFNSREYKNRYKELVSPYDRFNIGKFEYFKFEQEDREYLTIVLKSQSNLFARSYDDCAKELKGFTNLFTPLQYLEEVHAKDLMAFKKEDVIEHREKIEKIVLEKFLVSEYKHLSVSYEKIAKLSAKLEVFEELITKKFLKDFLLNQPKNVRSFSYESDSEKEKLKYLQKMLVELIAEDKSIVQVLDRSGYDILELFIDINKKNKDTKLNTSAFNNVLEYILSEKLNMHTYYYNRLNNLLEEKDFEEVFYSNSSINLLTILLSLSNSNKTAVNKIASRLDKNEVNKVVKYYKYKLPKDLVFKDTIPSTSENSFFHTQSIHRLFLDEDYREEILKDNIKLSMENISQLFSEKSPLFDSFLKSYINIHKKELLDNEDFINLIISHPKGEEYIKIDLDIQKQENILNKIYMLKKEEKDLYQQKNDFSRMFEEENNGDSYDQPEYKQYSEAISLLSEKIGKLGHTLSLSFIQDKAHEYLHKQDFKQFKNLSELFSSVRGGFSSYVNDLSFDTLLSCLENDIFRKELYSSLSYDNKSSINFSYNETQTKILFNLLLEGSDKIDKLSQAIAFFKLDDVREIVKQLLIKEYPEDLFYNYSYLPKSNSFRTKELIIPSYTNEEIYQAYLNIEKKSSFFNYKDINSRYYEFFSYAFEDNQKSYFDFVKYAKEHDLGLYAILSHYRIGEDFIEKRENETRDESSARFIKENFDIDLIIEGLDQVMTNIKSKTFNYDISDKIQRAMITLVEDIKYQSYYDKEDDNFQKKHIPVYNKEQTYKLIEVLFRQCPFFLLESRKIGAVEDLTEYLRTDFLPTQKVDIHNLLTNNITRNNFSEAHTCLSLIKEKIIVIIKHLLEEKKLDEVSYLSYLIKQSDFMEKNINYDYKKYSNSALINWSNRDDFKEIRDILEVSTTHYFLDKLLVNNNPVKRKIGKI